MPPAPGTLHLFFRIHSPDLPKDNGWRKQNSDMPHNKNGLKLLSFKPFSNV